MDITLNRPQARALKALRPGSRVVIPWGRGVGKSYFERLVWYMNVHTMDKEMRDAAGKSLKGVRITHLMPTFKACIDIHGKLLEEELSSIDGAWRYLRGVINRTRWMTRFPGGSYIQWFGTKEANASRGLRTDIVTLDEADDIDPEVYDAVVLPWLSEPWSRNIVLLGGTPRRGRYGLLYREYRRALDGGFWKDKGKDENGQSIMEWVPLPQYKGIHATFRDAAMNVNQETTQLQYDLLVSAGKKAVAEREYMCNFDAAEGLVYAHFEREFHVREPHPRAQFTEIIVGCDWGWEDPTALIVIGVIGRGRDAVCFVLEEIYQSHMRPSEIAAKAKALRLKYGAVSMSWYGDPSRPDIIDEIRHHAKITVKPADNNREAGVGTVGDMLAKKLDPYDDMYKARGATEPRRVARLYIHPRCQHTLAEIATYKRKRDPKDPDRIMDEIQDGNDHAMDALRYGIRSHFGGPVLPDAGMGQRYAG